MPPFLKGTSQECRDEEEDVEEVYSDPEPLSPRQLVITNQEELTHPSRPKTEGIQHRRDEQRGEAKKKFEERRVSLELEDAVKVSDPKPPSPFLVAKKKKTKAKQENQEYLRFVKMLKEVNLNISAYDIFTGTPK